MSATQVDLDYEKNGVEGTGTFDLAHAAGVTIKSESEAQLHIAGRGYYRVIGEASVRRLRAVQGGVFRGKQE